MDKNVNKYILSKFIVTSFQILFIDFDVYV